MARRYPQQRVCLDECVLKLVKLFRGSTSPVTRFNLMYRFSKTAFAELCKISDAVTREDSIPRNIKGELSFSHFPSEPTIILFYSFDNPRNSRSYPYKITSIQDGERVYIFEGGEETIRVFPSGLS